ncbi:tetratricopeptide repeat protein [Mycolicibacterium chubuense NBB4]|uniref:Tetratricopeptide repeat protein n=1 Tax=Mycolicibacterium chubuense (strain NBB4) TaxID=710421 RepID=I4BKB9_MYCCN|nr:FxSxx-COOH system tetratricopeptide repeat protein [Mycolicibacterium chubuense]AFM17726.1 tetratricopeptide repeat protein [Mycolicibacterium chubuense NBB4]
MTWIQGQEWDSVQGAGLAVLLGATFPNEPAIREVLDNAGIGLEYMPAGLTSRERWHILLRELQRAGHLSQVLSTISAENVGLAGKVEALSQRSGQQVVAPVGHNRGIVVGKIPAEPTAFISRETVQRLERLVETSHVAVVTAITGMRGVGKSQIAAAYVRSRLNDGLGLIGWLDAETARSLVDGLATIAERLHIADPEADSEESAERLRDFLSTWAMPSLLVFDNAEDPDLVRQFIPSGGRSTVIVTAADRAFEQLGVSVEADVYAREESLQYLHDITGLGKTGLADVIAEKLGDLPLAIAQAAATIRDQRLSYEDYLDRLTDLPISELLSRAPGADYPRSTAAALLLAVAGVDEELGATASVLLRVMATLSPAGVRRDLLYTLVAADPGRRERNSIDTVLQHCARAAVVSWSTENAGSVIMHRLLARLIRESAITKKVYNDALSAAINTLKPHLFDYWHSTWHRREEGRHLIDQIDSLWASAEGIVNEPNLIGELIGARRWALRQMHALSDTTNALEAAKSLREDCLALFGAHDRRTIRSNRDYADAIRAAGKASDAVPVLEETLRTAETALGRRDLETLTCRADLAYALRFAERVPEAIELEETTVRLRTELLGELHPDTMTVVNNLAACYRKVNRLDEAIELYEQNLRNRRAVLGEDHQQTLFSRHNLAMAYRTAGRAEEALELMEPVLADRERILGNDHPQTTASRNVLAFIYRSLNRGEESLALFEQNYYDRVRTLGPDHPRTLLSQNNLVYAYLLTKRSDEALMLAEDAVTRRERLLGPDDPKTLTTRRNLALSYLDVGRTDEALRMLEDVYADWVRVMGDLDPDTLTTNHYLGMAYARSGKLSQAAATLQAVLTGREATLGADSLKTANTQRRLGEVFEQMGKIDAAVALLRSALTTYEQRTTPESTDAEDTRHRLARLTGEGRSLDPGP